MTTTEQTPGFAALVEEANKLGYNSVAAGPARVGAGPSEKWMGHAIARKQHTGDAIEVYAVSPIVAIARLRTLLTTPDDTRRHIEGYFLAELGLGQCVYCTREFQLAQDDHCIAEGACWDDCTDRTKHRKH